MIKWKEYLVRINPNDSTKMQFSADNGTNWNEMYVTNIGGGQILDLTDNGDEILATTSKGLFYTKDRGYNWNKRG